ncbi:hypothetical protein MRX96_027473 [Rhipicephalus microplus]
MALQLGFRAAKNFKRLACGISHLRLKSNLPENWDGGVGKQPYQMKTLLMGSYEVSLAMMITDPTRRAGGAGGSIREAGGSFGKMERAREEEYFRRTQKAQFKMLQDHIHKEIIQREQLIEALQTQIDRNKKIVEELKQQQQRPE